MLRHRLPLMAAELLKSGPNVKIILPLFAVVTLLSESGGFAANPIQIENAKAGDPGWILQNEAASGEIEGFASATSVNRGEQIRFYVNTTSPSFQLIVYRLGWYGGVGARRVHGPISLDGVSQPIPSPAPVTGLIECNWTDPYILSIPAPADPTEWASGIYVAKLITPANKQKFIVFVVRDDTRPSNHNFQSAVLTNQAYNNWGGKSLYNFNSIGGAAQKVSFNRPYVDGAGSGNVVWRWEYSMVRFMEREGFDVTYSTNIDTARRGELLTMHRSFLSIGHDEYWSAEMRNNVEWAISNGVSAGFFSGNNCYWQVRLEPSIHTGEADRTVVGHKERALLDDPYALDSDPSNDQYITTKWRNAPVARPEDMFIGVKYVYDPISNGDIVIDDTTSAPWVFEHTGLTTGSRLVAMLGYEVDAIGSGSPANIIRLGHSPFTNNNLNPPQTDYSNMTVYTAPSGATVFATGSIQWAWGLDDFNTTSTDVPVSEPGRQLTRNVLRRFAGSNASYDCQYAITPSSTTLSYSAGSGSFTVTTTKGCTWIALSSEDWMHLTEPTSGDGSAVVHYTYDENFGAARTVSISVGDRTFNARQVVGSGISVMDLTARGHPNGSASLVWSTMTGAVSYEVGRSSSNTAFLAVGTTTTSSFNDVSLTRQSTYLYRIRALDGAGATLGWSNIDAAGTFSFTDDPIAFGTIIKAVHFVELRAAVNSLRTAVGLPPAQFTDPGLTAGYTVRAAHLTELRSAVDAAFAALGRDSFPYADPSVGIGRTIRFPHINELRAAVR